MLNYWWDWLFIKTIAVFDINCDSTGNNSSCATVTASVTMVGDSNDKGVFVERSSLSLLMNFEVEGVSGWEN